ncbi:MAG TPA: diguanylate cyclase [Gammaproteobacteria bacterium]|nr:diguanylate cyclase [Gammaproteobacteria bacterium]
MQWFNNLRIITKLTTAFLAVLVLSLFIGIYALFHLDRVNTMSLEIEGNWLPSAVITSEMSTHIAHIRIAELQHILSDNRPDMAKYELAMVEHLDSVIDRQRRYEPLIYSPEGGRLYRDFTKAWNAYRLEHNKILALSSENKTVEARNMLRDESEQLFTQVTDALDELVKLNVRSAVTAARHSTELYALASIWIIIALAVSMLAGLGLAFAMAHHISGRINHLDQAAKRVAAGDLDVQVAAGAKDELGSLARSLNKAVQNTRGMVERISETESSLRKSQQQLELFFSQSVAGFFFISFEFPLRWNETINKSEVLEDALISQNIIKINSAMLSLYGISREQYTQTGNMGLLVQSFARDKDLLASLFNSGRLHIESEVYKANGNKIWVESDYICLYDEARHITGYFGIQRDVTENRAQALALQHQATHDALTNLPNRILLYERFHQAMFAARQEQGTLALLLMDLDGFKLINDTVGHHIGDRVLQEVAARVQDVLRESDTVARLGGDEFVVLLPTMGREGAVRTAAKIKEALGREYNIEELALGISASIGIALWPEHGSDIKTLLRLADQAMYIAKQKGANFALYDEGLAGEDMAL